MAEAPSPTTLDAFAVDKKSEDETWVGRVAFGPEGRLALLEALPEREAFLRRALENLNAKSVIVEKVPPGPDATPGAIATRSIPRTDEDFLRALQDYALRYYGLRLG